MTGRERLAHLEKRLRRFPKSKKFHMGSWWQKVPECGTACCALGYAATLPVFQREGLGLERLYDEGEPSHATPFIIVGDNGARAYGYLAAEGFFDIGYRTASHLFDPDYYLHLSLDNIDPEDVANRIAAYLKETA